MRVGERIGPFRIVRELGRGGMGTVYSAEDERLQRPVALKLAHGGADDQTARRRLLREARAAATVVHPHIAAIYEVGEADGAVYIAMELVGGQSLRGRLDAGPMETAEALRIAGEIAAGLAHLHKAGVIHRDLKPENVLLDEGGRVRLVDFGIAKVRGPMVDDGSVGTMTREGDLIGTPSYMSPEQAEGRPVDARSDVFSFGALVYEMVSGRRAFTGDSAMQVLASVLRDAPPPLVGAPRDLARAIDRCLEKDPADRFPDLDRVVDALVLVRLDVPELAPAAIIDPLAFGEESTVRAPLPGLAPARPPRRRWRWIAIAGVVVASAALALVVPRWRRGSGGASPTWRPVVSDLPRPYDERAQHLALSPDGRWLAYTSDRDEPGNPSKIYVQATAVRRGDGPPPPFDGVASPNGQSSDLRWARDGASLLDAGGKGLFRIPAAGSAPVSIRGPTVSADDCGGGRIVVAEPSPACPACARVMVVGGGEPERELLALRSGIYPRMVRCDPDRRRVLVWTHRSEAGLLEADLVRLDWVRRPGTKAFHAVSQRGGFGVTFLGDSFFVAESKAGVTRSDLVERSLAHPEREPRELIFGGGHPINPEVSADGSTLAFIDDQASRQLVAQELGQRQDRFLSGSIHYVPAINLVATRDGGEVFATLVEDTLGKDGQRRPEQMLWAYPTSGAGEARSLGRARSWDVTPAGDELIVTTWAAGADGKVRRVIAATPFTGGAPRVLTAVGGEPRDVRMGADGRVHFADRVPRAFRARSVSLAGGDVVDDGPAPFTLVLPLASGHRLVVIGSSADAVELRLVPPRAALDVAGAVTFWAVAFTIDRGAVVYWPKDHGTLRRIQVDGTEEDLGIVPHSEEWTVSADGQTVYSTGLQGTARPKIISNLGSRPPL